VFTEGEFTTAPSEPAVVRSPLLLVGAVAVALLTVLGLIRLTSSSSEVAEPAPTATAVATSTPVPTPIPGRVVNRVPLVTSLDDQPADVCPDGRDWNEAIASEAATEVISQREFYGGTVDVTVLSGPVCDRIQLSLIIPNATPPKIDTDAGIIRLESPPPVLVQGDVPDSDPTILTWTDMASGEPNVIAIGEGANGPEIVISFGAGDVRVRPPTASFPQLHIIDIAQNSTPTGLLFGPIPVEHNAASGASLALLKPLQIDLTGPGRASEIPVHGITVDPENTVIQLTPWDESLPFSPGSMSDAYPVIVQGLDDVDTVTEGVREFSPPNELFDVQLVGVSQGSWILTMTLNPGTPEEQVVGQRFRVINDPGGPGESADPIPAFPERIPADAADQTCDLPPTSAFNSSSVTTNLWTTPACDRILIILPQGMEDRPVISVDDRLGIIDINLGDVTGSPERVVWPDAATDNMNLLVLDDQSDGLHVHLSYGSGEAAVRQLADPDRLEIIIEQEPWPPGMIAGPIMIRDNAPRVVLSTPLQPDISGPGMSGEVVLRGYASDPTNTLIEVRKWDEEWRGSVVTRNDQFNRNTLGPVVPVVVQGLRPDEDVFEATAGFAPTDKLFEITLLDLPADSWVVTVTANADTAQEEVVGQYFRKADDPSNGGALALPIASRRDG